MELRADVVEHCKAAVANWQEASANGQLVDNIHVLHGNALHIDISRGEACFGFDRIYIGAAIRLGQLHQFAELLKPGGILVGPVEDELVKIVRVETDSSEEPTFCKSVLSEVNFSPLLSRPNLSTTLPSRVWEPSSHQLYPQSSRACSKALMLCAQSGFLQEETSTAPKINLAALLPQALWLEILSYAHRDCK